MTPTGESAMAYYRRTPEPAAADLSTVQGVGVHEQVVRADPLPTERDELDRLFLGTE